MAVLPTGFGKSLIYPQNFVLAKEMDKSSVGCSSGSPSCLVIVPLRSIIEEQINSNEFDLEVKGFSFSLEHETVNLLQSTYFFCPPCSPPPLPTGIFLLSPGSFASRDQDGGPSNSTIDFYDLREK